jgi:hypothetical protein
MVGLFGDSAAYISFSVGRRYRSRCFFLCGAVLAQEMLVVMLCWRITQESIGRPWRVKLKRDVNGLEGRVKPSV